MLAHGLSRVVSESEADDWPGSARLESDFFKNQVSKYSFYFIIFVLFQGTLNFWQDKNNANRSFSRDSNDKSVWYENVDGKRVFTFKLINENQNEVLIFDESRVYTAYVKLNDKSCLFSLNRDSEFSEIYSGSWKNAGI